MKHSILLLAIWFLTACAGLAGGATPMAEMPTLARNTLLPPAVYTGAATLTPEPTNTQALLPTLDPYQAYTIPSLRMRSYGGGKLESLEKMSENEYFTRYYVRYPSDGLTIYGFMNIPKGDGPFPVIIAVHGYVTLTDYQTLDYTSDAADGLANEGYLVLHPNLRNYPPSDNGDNLFRAGMAIDVLNLIALVKTQGSQPGPLEKADPSRLGLWGHSMGGGVALKVITLSNDVKAALLYASISGDEKKNSQFFYDFLRSPDSLTELAAPPEAFAQISPATYYANVTAAVAIYHGTADAAIPLAWAQETCQQLTDAKINVQCTYYDGAEHTFRSRYMGEFGPSVLAFYDTYLRK